MSSKKSKSKTKKVSQNDLRKMMNEMKNKRATDSQTVVKESRKVAGDPGAYKKALNDRKKLQALIGATPVENPKKGVSKTKIDNVNKGELTKSLKRSFPAKTLVQDTGSSANGRESKAAKIEPKTKETENTIGLPVGDYASDSEEEKEQQVEMQDEKKDSEKEADKPTNTDSSIPAGFFDDPEVDAKKRGVETPADAMDREWEEFQKEIQREAGQSEQIVEEAEETGKVDREIEEIDEQMMHFSKVQKLEAMRSLIKRKIAVEKIKKDEIADSDEESGSEDAEDILDWREKDSHF